MAYHKWPCFHNLTNDFLLVKYIIIHFNRSKHLKLFLYIKSQENSILPHYLKTHTLSNYYVNCNYINCAMF